MRNTEKSSSINIETYNKLENNHNKLIKDNEKLSKTVVYVYKKYEEAKKNEDLLQKKEQEIEELKGKLIQHESTNRLLLMMLGDQNTTINNFEFMGPDNIC